MRKVIHSSLTSPPPPLPLHPLLSTAASSRCCMSTEFRPPRHLLVTIRVEHCGFVASPLSPYPTIPPAALHQSVWNGATRFICSTSRSLCGATRFPSHPPDVATVAFLCRGGGVPGCHRMSHERLPCGQLNTGGHQNFRQRK